MHVCFLEFQNQLLLRAGISRLLLEFGLLLCLQTQYFLKVLLNIFMKYYVIIWLGFVIIKCLNTRKRFLRAVDLLIIGAVVASIIGIVESITGFNGFHLLNTMGAQITLQPLRFGFRRIISFTYQTISFCNYCMFALGLIVYRISVCR